MRQTIDCFPPALLRVSTCTGRAVGLRRNWTLSCRPGVARRRQSYPPKGNDKTREFARTLRASVDSDAAFVGAVLNKFSREPYVYTLQPELLSNLNAMDEFFIYHTPWVLRTLCGGFCLHAALRRGASASEWWRGYQGGEVNPVNKTVIVHQFDAHAWTEVWLQDKGWTQFDPTASVSPDRIEWGLERAVREEGSFLANAPPVGIALPQRAAT